MNDIDRELRPLPLVTGPGPVLDTRATDEDDDETPPALLGAAYPPEG